MRCNIAVKSWSFQFSHFWPALSICFTNNKQQQKRFSISVIISSYACTNKKKYVYQVADREESWALADMPLNHIFVAFSFNMWEIINKRQHIYNLHNISRSLAARAHTKDLKYHFSSRCSVHSLLFLPQVGNFSLDFFPTRKRWTRRQPEVPRMRQIKLGGFYPKWAVKMSAKIAWRLCYAKKKYKFNFHTCEPSWPMLEAQRWWCEGDPDVA